MNLRRTLHNNKGYTLIELMITLFIFAIITMFGVPAFYGFIEKSRAQNQMVKAANFLRSAQEIATSTNRIVYVYTTGYFNYTNHQDNYWMQDWVMSFKPIGRSNIRASAQDLSLEDPNNVGTPNPNYLIAQQSIFTPSNVYTLNVLGSTRHNSIDRRVLNNSSASGNIEMEGYSYVREKYPDNPNGQGTDIGKPTYMIFYPSGAVVMPVFVMAEQPFADNDFFTNLPTKLSSATGVLAGCRIGGGLTIDVINYTFNTETIRHARTFTASALAGTSGSPPSFSQSVCGSRFLQ